MSLLFPLDQVFALLAMNKQNDQAPTPEMSKSGVFYPEGTVFMVPGTNTPDSSKMVQDTLNKCRGLHLIRTPGKQAYITAGINGEVCPRVQAEGSSLLDKDVPQKTEIDLILNGTLDVIANTIKNPSSFYLEVAIKGHEFSIGVTAQVDSPQKAHPSLIAARFLELVSYDLTPEELQQIDERNIRETDPAVCHSHDFLDATKYMTTAFRKVMQRDYTPDKYEGDAILWNASWDIVKHAGFSKFFNN